MMTGKRERHQIINIFPSPRALLLVFSLFVSQWYSTQPDRGVNASGVSGEERRTPEELLPEVENQRPIERRPRLASDSFESTRETFSTDGHSGLTATGSQHYPIEISSRIVGGQNCQCGRYRSLCALYAGKFGSAQICGGTLIAPNVILTAAHCSPVVDRARCNIFNKRDGPGESTCGVSGGTNDGEMVEEFRVVEKHEHPSYGEGIVGNSHDFALLRLDKSSDQRPMKLLQDRSVLHNDMWLTVAGWGMLCETVDENGRPCASSGHCREVNVQFMPVSECRKYYGTKRVTDDMICAGVDTGGKDACQGDSGGPLFFKGRAPDGSEDILVGVVSWGRGCAREFSPGVYGSIVDQLYWISRNACNMGASEMCTLLEATSLSREPERPSSGRLSPDRTSPDRPEILAPERPLPDWGAESSVQPADTVEQMQPQQQQQQSLEHGYNYDTGLSEFNAHSSSTQTLIPVGNGAGIIPMFYECESLQRNGQCRNMSFKGRSGNIRPCFWVGEKPERRLRRCQLFQWCCPESCEFDCDS